MLTARILYYFYTVITLIEALVLYLGNTPFFDSITIAFSTAGTGGFAIKNASIAAYNSLYIEVVVSLFMIIFGINFNLFYLVWIRQAKRAFKSEEFRVYISIIVVSTVTIVCNILPSVNSIGAALRQAGFTVTSIISTTGFVTADFQLWPTFSKCVIIALMFVGGMAGSTGGGLKVARIIILFKSAFREILRAIRPNSVKCIKLDGAVIDDKTVSVITCVNNVGPGLNAVGPTSNFSSLTDFSKIVLTLDMLIGRLEIFPLIVLFSPATWKKNS